VLLRAALVFLAFLVFPLHSGAQTLYVASVRSQGSSGQVGSLYTVNLATGSATFAAPLRVNGMKPVGITGLAVHPTTGAMYGITSTLSPNFPGSLVSIDTATGDTTVIGQLHTEGSDIAFDSSGTLYIWLPSSRQIATVNIATGAITKLGEPGTPDTTGGLAIDARGVAFVVSSGALGTLDTVDLRTGAIREGPKLSGAPFPAGINSMSFSLSGLLLAVNTNAGAPAATRLVTINTATGAMSLIGTLPDDSDAMTFAVVSRDIGQVLGTMSGRTLALLALILGLALALLGMVLVKLLRR
jgi:DNA-binding beta-propeller fold protein YncE